MSLYGSLIKQEADYTTTCDEKLPECEKLALVNIHFNFNLTDSFNHLIINFNRKEIYKKPLKSYFS